MIYCWHGGRAPARGAAAPHSLFFAVFYGMLRMSLSHAHLLHQALIKLLGGVIAHLLLAVIHCRDLDDDGEVSSGHYGDGERGDIIAENIDPFVVKAESVVHLVLYPMLEVYDKVDLFGLLDRAHTEYTADIDDADAAKLDIVLYDRGRRADQCLCRDLFYLDRIIGDETVTSLDKLDGGLALTDPAVAENEYTLAVDLDKNSVTGYSRRKVRIERAYERGVKGTCLVLCGKDRYAELACLLTKLGEDGQVACEYYRRRQMLGKGDELGPSVVRLKTREICVLCVSYDTYALAFEDVVKARECESRTPDLGSCYHHRVVILGYRYAFE